MSKQTPEQRPNIYEFHDYRDFLKKWLNFRIQIAEKFSIRRLAKLSGISSGYIPMVLSGERNISLKTLAKIEPYLGLNTSEISYFKHLIVLSDSASQEKKVASLGKMQSFNSYTSENDEEVRAYKLLTKWYNIVIREMVQLKDFSSQIDWIKSKIISRIYKKEVKASIEFLTKNGFLKEEDGKLVQTQKELNCVGSVFKVGLTEFHKEMFRIAADSIEETPSEWRSIVGHTLSISKEQFPEVKEILDEALLKISKIKNDKKSNEVVFHTSLVAFPLTKIDGVHEVKK